MTPRYNLRTLLLLLAILPPVLAVGWWRYQSWLAERAERERRSLKITWMIGPTVNQPSCRNCPHGLRSLKCPRMRE